MRAVIEVELRKVLRAFCSVMVEHGRDPRSTRADLEIGEISILQYIAERAGEVTTALHHARVADLAAAASDDGAATSGLYASMSDDQLEELRTAFECDLAVAHQEPASKQRTRTVAFGRGRVDLIAEFLRERRSR